MSGLFIAPQVAPAAVAALAGDVAQKSVSTAAAGTLSLFTVAGGRVLVLELYGTPTVRVGAGAVTAKVQATSSNGDANDLCTAATIASAPVDRHYSVPGNTITTLRTGSGEGGVAGILPPGIIVPPGTIQLVLVGNSGAGTMLWTVLWAPLDVGATLVAA